MQGTNALCEIDSGNAPSPPTALTAGIERVGRIGGGGSEAPCFASVKLFDLSANKFTLA